MYCQYQKFYNINTSHLCSAIDNVLVPSLCLIYAVRLVFNWSGCGVGCGDGDVEERDEGYDCSKF